MPATTYQRVAAADSYDTSVVSPVYFAGVDEYLKTNAIASLVQPTTCYLVVNQVSWTAADRFFDGDANNSGSLYQAETSPNIRAFAGGAEIAENPDLAVGTYGVVSVVFNGASSLTQVNNGTPQTANAGASNMGGFTLATNGLLSAFGNISCREIAVFSAAHSAAQRATVISYLRAKWGV